MDAGRKDASQVSIMATMKAESHGAEVDEDSGTFNVGERGTYVRMRTLRDIDEPVSEEADYELLEKLGEGGMGIVYRARQCSMNREVAIKRIKPASQTAQSRAKFMVEAAVTGELAHPNIVPIHDLGSNKEGDLFYSMKVVTGDSWRDVIGKKALAENIETLMRVADAVAFAHARNIVHRDLKPENVMLGDFGEVLVMDWGLAGKLEPGKSLPAGGTPAYMAPEMAREFLSQVGQPTAEPLAPTGKGSDIYLMGAMLFEIVTGHPPHASDGIGSPREQAFQCLCNAAENKFVDHGGHAGELLTIAMQAMSDHPGDRFLSVGEFQDTLRVTSARPEYLVVNAGGKGPGRSQANPRLRDVGPSAVWFSGCPRAVGRKHEGRGGAARGRIGVCSNGLQEARLRSGYVAAGRQQSGAEEVAYEVVPWPPRP